MAKRKGFALLSREQVQAIARKGALTAQRKGLSHQFTSEEAKLAGAKGGRASRGGLGKNCTCGRDEDGFVVWSLACPRVLHVSRAAKALNGGQK